MYLDGLEQGYVCVVAFLSTFCCKSFNSCPLCQRQQGYGHIRHKRPEYHGLNLNLSIVYASAKMAKNQKMILLLLSLNINAPIQAHRFWCPICKDPEDRGSFAVLDDASIMIGRGIC